MYEMMRRRGGRTSYQNMREAVEEACSKRFLVSTGRAVWPAARPCAVTACLPGSVRSSLRPAEG